MAQLEKALYKFNEFIISINSDKSLNFNHNEFFLNAYQVSEDGTKEHLSIKVSPKKNLTELGPVFPKIAIMKTRMCKAYQVSLHKRYFEYNQDDKQLAVALEDSSKGTRRITVYCDDESVVREILYFYVLSCHGEWAENQNNTRLHAASFTYNNAAYLIYGKEGAGKSTLSFCILENNTFDLLGDEIALLEARTGLNIPICLPLSLKKDSLLSVSSEHQKNIKFKHFFSGKNFITINNKNISNLKKLKIDKIFFLSEKMLSTAQIKFRIIFAIIVGEGLPQMAEYFIRPNNVVCLIRILGHRLCAAFKIVFNCDFVCLPRSINPNDRFLRIKDILIKTNT